MNHQRARFGGIVAAFLLALLTGAVLVAQSKVSGDANAGLTVHEWGTFTSIAGVDGKAIQWRPLSGPSDLPCFVRAMPGEVKVVNASQVGNPVLGAMAATVRMETPVLYFYSSRETTVDVGVQFPNGLITEWYPHAAVQPAFSPGNLASARGTIAWNGVRVLPNTTPAFLTERSESHYYAARGTDAAPVQVNGQTEKFLFYRGIAGFQVPVLASESKRGAIVVESPSVRLDHVVYFENRGGHVGYQILDGVQGRVTIDPPELTSNIDALGWDLERMLTSQGLYPREAKAMVATWRDSWFEEGARVFYLLPQSAVDALLPLSITPRPAQIARAFVGRLEVLTSPVLDDAERAFARKDLGTLNKYGRFLEPIAWRLLGQPSTTLNADRVTSMLRAIAASHVPEVTCR